MKTIFKVISFCLLICAVASCQMKEDDIFDVDPATRADNWMADYRRVFNNNEYGWALYTDNPTYGRHPAVYCYAVRFDPEFCTFYKSSATQRLPGAYMLDSAVSSYSFKSDNGIVISFDTYNPMFHYYADQSQYFSQDLQGDFEFCLDRYSDNEDTIFGRGKTKQLPFFMVKMNMTPQEYQAKSDGINSYAAYNCVMICEGDTLTARFLSGYHNLIVNFADEEGGDIEEHLYSYGNLTNGIYLLENFKYKNTTVVEMNLDTISGEFICPRTGSKIGPKPLVNYFVVDTEDDNFFFGYSGLGSWTKGEWDKAKTALNKSKYKASNLVYIGLLPNGDGTMDLVFNKWYGDGEIHFPLEVKKVSNDEFAVRRTGDETSGLGYKVYDLGLNYIVDAFASKDEWKTYKITFRSGNAMVPSGLEITDESNPDNSIYFETNFRYYHQSIWD